MPTDDLPVFISYSWRVEKETHIVDELEKLCQQSGLKLIRDSNRLKHGDSIKSFMLDLVGGEHVITVFSDAYFKSPWCMYELLKIYQRGDFQQRTHPVIADDCNLQDRAYRLSLVSYWKKKCEEARLELSQHDPLDVLEEFSDPKLYRDIQQNISKLLNFAAGRLTTQTTDLKEKNYAPLLDKIRSLADCPMGLANGFQELAKIIKQGDLLDSVEDKLYDSILACRPQSSWQYNLYQIAYWQHRYRKLRLQQQFCHLTLMVYQEESGGVYNFNDDQRFTDFYCVPSKVENLPLVLLGAPGSGKSTLLRRYALDEALTVIRADDAIESVPFAFFVPLNEYDPQEKLTPHEWLQQRWKSEYSEMPPLDKLAKEQRVTLLLDALNEIPRTVDFKQVIKVWSCFLEQNSYYRVRFSCRSLDYSHGLKFGGSSIPHVRVEPLDGEGIQRFLAHYAPDNQQEVWGFIEDNKQQDLYNTPYYLSLLVAVVVESRGRLPCDHAELFSEYLRRSWLKELEERENLRLDEDSSLITRDDLEDLKYSCEGYDLPEGVLINTLAEFAYGMQDQFNGKGGLVVLKYRDAAQLVKRCSKTDAHALFKAGVDLKIVQDYTQKRTEKKIQFIHQLMQEYFAARRLAKQPNADLVRVAWRSDEVDKPLAEALAELKETADQLEALPTTGWEETTLLAVLMTADQEAFVRELMESNLPLAGRCAAQAGVDLSAAFLDELKGALWQRNQDPDADLRARIEAGKALGNLGDHPALERRLTVDDKTVLVSPMVTIPAGEYSMGCDDSSEEDERPKRQVYLEAFQIARYPLTNGEWQQFMDDGGYKDERWWSGSEESLAWWRGETTSRGNRESYRTLRRYFKADFSALNRHSRKSAWHEDYIRLWKDLVQSEEKYFEKWLIKNFPEGKCYKPECWNDMSLNNFAQPVVGISWYEASAYCHWINDVLNLKKGDSFHLPAIDEWKAAAGGLMGRRYAWGDSESMEDSCNSRRVSLGQTSPIGCFLSGDTPSIYRISDLSGNCCEWSDSYNGLNCDERLICGGSWDNSLNISETTFHNWLDPATRDRIVGMRLFLGA